MSERKKDKEREKEEPENPRGCCWFRPSRRSVAWLGRAGRSGSTRVTLLLLSLRSTAPTPIPGPVYVYTCPVCYIILLRGYTVCRYARCIYVKVLLYLVIFEEVYKYYAKLVSQYTNVKHHSQNTYVNIFHSQNTALCMSRIFHSQSAGILMMAAYETTRCCDRNK